MGNYLNFSLGIESASIGYNIDAGNFNYAKDELGIGNESGFPVLNVKNGIHIGLEELKKFDSKNIKGGNFNIDNAPSNKNINEHTDNAAKLIIENKYYHSGEHESDQYTITKIPDGSKKFRTIFSHYNNLKKYDAFIFDQQNCEISNNNVDCKVSIANIKDYISKRVEKYIKTNTTSVPTGTIISQYCDLKKWYCVVDEKEKEWAQFNDYAFWQGYRPAMPKYPSYKLNTDELIESDPRNYSSSNVLYGAYKNKTFLIDKNGETSKELPPDFKRGYLLCDGSKIPLQLLPSFATESLNSSSPQTLELFFNLFYIIGHHYWIGTAENTNDISRPAIHRCVKSLINPIGGYTYYSIKNDGEIDKTIGNLFKASIGHKIDSRVVYAITMATILIFKWLESNKDKFETEKYNSIEKILNKLSTENINDEYVFNAIIPDGLNLANEYYEYTSADNKTIMVNIGKCISKFSDEIPYYEYDAKTGEFILVSCPIYKMAEAYELVYTYFYKKPRGYENLESIGWDSYVEDKYTYEFMVPCFYTTKTSNLNNQTYHIGQFVGSNGLVLANNIVLRSNENEITLTPSSGCSSIYEFDMNYRFSDDKLPHVHGVAKGKNVFEANHIKHDAYCYKPMEYLDSDDIIKDEYKNGRITSRPSYNQYNITNDFDNNECIIAADYHYTSYNLYKGATKTVNGKVIPPLSESDMYNYILQSVGPEPNGKPGNGSNKVLLTKVYNSYSGTAGYEWQNWENWNSTGSDATHGFKWYGKTSEALWEKSSSSGSEKYDITNNNRIWYFRPESIKVLPLIKL